jgi:hypothetical protein
MANWPNREIAVLASAAATAGQASKSSKERLSITRANFTKIEPLMAGIGLK